MYSETELKRLGWQCRRGLKEVEVLLIAFFEAHFAQAPPADQALFVALLEEYDADLFEWLTQRERAENEKIQYIIDVILRTLAPATKD
jgi:antitoxin CptB